MICLGLVILLMTLVTIVIALQTGTRAAQETAANLFDRSAALFQEKLDNLYGELMDVAELGAAMPAGSANLSGDGLRHPDRPFLAAMLNSHPSLYSVYLGYANGDFLQLINPEAAPDARAMLKAPAGTSYVLRAISGQANARRQTWTFVDHGFKKLGSRVEAKPDYDPRKVQWYSGAMNSQESYLGPPYVFSSLQEPGITASRRLPGTGTVFGADLTLSPLQEFIAAQRVSEHGLLLIYDTEGRLIAASQTAASVLGEATPLMELPGARARAVLAAARVARSYLPGDLGSLFLNANTWKLNGSGSMVILMGAPMEDFYGPYWTMRTSFLVMSLIALGLILPLTLLLSRRLSGMLATMAADAEKISQFDFSPTIHTRSVIREFNQLSGSVSVMKDTIESTMGKLKTLVDLGIKMSSLRDINELCEEILRGAMGLTRAQAGSLYLRGSGDNQDKLEFRIILNTKLVGFDQGGTTGKPITLKPVALFDENGKPHERYAVADAFHKDKTINIPDAANYTEHDLTGPKEFDRLTGFHTISILTVPLKPLGREVMGALQLMNACDAGGAVIPFNKGIEDLVRALSAQAATALSNQALLDEQKRLIEELRQLFESMINVIVKAIDAKSPYTGGHNTRVPIFANMLAEAVSQTRDGPLAGSLQREQNFKQQFKIAAMLHDCGKITTPEYVVDKATKLETIYNRIHEIRTRFEVLRRDAVIEHHERILKGGKKATSAADAWLAEQEARLQADFAFLAECNMGSEFMAPDKIERLQRIATLEWVRYFDDSLGLSWEELQRFPVGERQATPAREKLLADKSRHRIPREPEALKRYEHFKFQVNIPELKYNQGEIYNLGIQRGTLTPEERFKINEHIMQTIVMLTNLCENTEGLTNVVDWAGQHHETLKGTGYPYRRKAEDLSIPARIMSIADIFEALTAQDRPYKKAKPLSEAVRILFNFKKDGHIDPDLFDLFLSSGVFLEYGKRYLSPEQLDEVDISAYVGKMS
jgi:HD-GYP domain-containing protein (c-di-GMP phosphodiesterase class II)